MPVENALKVWCLNVTGHCQITFIFGRRQNYPCLTDASFCNEIWRPGRLGRIFLWKKMCVGLRQGLMLCQRPLEVLSHGLLKTFIPLALKFHVNYFLLSTPPSISWTFKKVFQKPQHHVWMANLWPLGNRMSPHVGWHSLEQESQICSSQRKRFLEPAPTNKDCT